MSNSTAGPPALGPATTGSASPPYPGGPAYPGAAAHGSAPPPLGFAPPVAVRLPRPAVWQGILACAAVVLVVIAHFWEVSRLSHQSALFQDAEAGRRVTVGQAVASDDGLNSSVVLQIAMAVIALVFVIVWAYCARSNAAAYTASPFRRSKGWAIGAWICPIVNLWFPYQVVKDIWGASDTQRPDAVWVKAWPVSAIVPLWWTCLVGGNVVQRLSASVYNSGDGADDVHRALILDFASAAANIAAALLFILIVATVTRFQTERYERSVGELLPTA
jgi:hypothetical protein